MSSHWPFRVRPLNNPNLTYCYNVEATPARIASEPTMDDEPASWRQKSLLTFDGGGIRGYTSLLLLEELMIHIGRTEHTYNVVHATSYGPCEKPKGLNHRDTGLQQEKFENCRRGGVYQPVRPGSPAAERNDARVHDAEAYLPLGPAITLNETQHRRTASFNSDMSYSMLRFLGGSDYYHRCSIEHDSTIFEPESLFRICMKAKILASLCQHILLWLDFVNVVTISPGSLWSCCDCTTDARWLNCSECNHTRCENRQRKCIKSGI
ncbi:hypothetical protein NA56DRAFT_700292 [Hyaloscypha hepaticicola]|uniref:PNPLA domain-containing protein n=1 Tax=Hyaloscypha hepaticicola TaxID=2082293 RepID=A0A2J6QEF1_9HELO|nr:hypothetical protein NA56DRAFT_700292 [Hyaloscypha hepaticicola]